MSAARRNARGKFVKGVVAAEIERLSLDPRVALWTAELSARNRYRNMWCLNKVLCDGWTLEDLCSRSVVEVKQHVRLVASRWTVQEKFSVAKHIQDAVSGFLQSCDVDFVWRRKERVRVRAKKINIEVIPDTGDVYRMSDAASRHGCRNRAVVLTVWQAGVRLNAVGRLTVGMVRPCLYPEIRAPIMLRITNEIDTKLSSYGLGYYVTFLGLEAAEAVKAYLDERCVRSGGRMPGDDEPLFLSRESGRVDVLKAITPLAAYRVVKNAAQRAGLNAKGIWTHTLRKSFRKILNRSVIDEDTKEALMGHKLPGSRGNYFDYHDLDEVGEKYRKADFSRSGSSNVGGLRRENEDLRRRMEELKDGNAERDEKIQEMRILMERQNRKVLDYFSRIDRIEKRIGENGKEE